MDTLEHVQGPGPCTGSLLAFIALSPAQSSAQTRIHSAILVIDTSINASYNEVHWLVRTPYLSIKASNEGAVYRGAELGYWNPSQGEGSLHDKDQGIFGTARLKTLPSLAGGN